MAIYNKLSVPAFADAVGDILRQLNFLPDFACCPKQFTYYFDWKKFYLDNNIHRFTDVDKYRHCTDKNKFASEFATTLTDIKNLCSKGMAETKNNELFDHLAKSFLAINNYKDVDLNKAYFYLELYLNKRYTAYRESK